MWSWIRNIGRQPPCDVCGRRHGNGSGGILVTNIVPHDVIFPGHEYVVIVRDGGTRPLIWRLGFLGAVHDIRDGTGLIFTAARGEQEDDTVIVVILPSEITSAREVEMERDKRHGGRNVVEEAKEPDS